MSDAPRPAQPVEDAAAILGREMGLRAPADRDLFLREMLAHTAAALALIHGSKRAAEATYALGDQIVARGG